MSAILSGTMQELIKRTVEFATQRKQFDRTIDQFGAIQEKIALMTMRHYITEVSCKII
ncbi:unnamed protein product [Protopolystoma xenopodis]|uniref:Acyl-CoA dehydrogenase/oxidase C-terminal domain-containing protein n=1 Tax=Protopolystoma xenopodis TaxID=117903 RepID=A0A448XA87_9PLAT|nr:unnamed protein product [Protopolystoma xenopodis]